MIVCDAQARLDRLAKQKKRPYCDICRKPIFEESEYVKTRRAPCYGIMPLVLRKEKKVESKEIKDFRRDAVTRIRKVATIEVSYITKEGAGKHVERFAKPYTNAADLRRKLAARMAQEEKLLTDMRIVEELTALFGMDEDEFFQKAKVLKVLEEKKGE